jgi:L-ascorbate metabolism protein UlaG (beta-lactamase superfamily)
MLLTYLGQSAFHIKTGQYNLILDPMISQNPLAHHIDVEALQADYILLSHGHGDHVADAETIARRTDAKIISNFEIVTWYEKKGINGHPMNLGGKYAFDFGTVKYVVAQHSSMLPDESYGGPSGGFVVWNDERSFYYAGDTSLTLDMQLIPMTCPSLDFAIMPIGDNFTMGYEDAIIASDFVQCNKIIGCHYDTFGFIKIDHDAAKKAFADAGKQLILLNIGESIEL